MGGDDVEKGLQACQKTVTVCNVSKQTFFGGIVKKVYIIRIMALFLIAFISNNVFASNGNKGDWGFDPKYYNYALIEGEITSIDYNKGIFHYQWKGCSFQ